MSPAIVALLSLAVTVLQVSCGTSATLEKLLEFEQRARNAPVVYESQQHTKIDFPRNDIAPLNVDTCTSLTYVSDGDLSKANTGEYHSIRLRGQDQYTTQVGIIIDFWYPFIGQNTSGPIVAYEGFVQWFNSSGGATSRVTEGGIGHTHVRFQLSHPLPGMMGYLYDYLILWRVAEH